MKIAARSLLAYEVRYGVARLKIAAHRSTQLESFLFATTILPFDDACARIAGQVLTRLDQAGEPIAPIDVLIAATAILVTRNPKEFKRVQGLVMEDW